MSTEVSVTRDIEASPELVWSLISDVGRMGEWSPENQGGEWIGGASGPVPGVKFRAANRNGNKSWKTVSTLVDVEPGRRFSFRVGAMGLKFADWSYDIEPTPNGCRVTETCTDLRLGFFKPIARMVTGVADRDSHNRAGMEQTLERLAAAAEAGG